MPWTYSDKHEVIKHSKKASAGVDSTQKELKELRAEMREMRDEQRQLLKAFNALTQQVAQMREEMYPASAKSALKRPGAKTALNPQGQKLR